MSVVFRVEGCFNVEIECVVDTWLWRLFNPTALLVADLGLPYVVEITANLANDSTVATNVHEATIVWNSIQRQIVVLGMGRLPLIGTALLEDYHLSIDFCEGGTVLVDGIL